MKRQLDLDEDLRVVQEWLMGESYSASGYMKDMLRELWWAYQEARDRSESLTAILVAAASKSLELHKPTNPITTVRQPTTSREDSHSA